MLVHLNGPSAMALSTHPRLSVNSAGRNGLPDTMTVFQTLPSKASLMRKARSKALASTSRQAMVKGPDRRDSRMGISGARRTSRIMAQSPPRLRLVGGDTLRILMMRHYRAPRSEGRRRRRRRIGGQGQRMHIRSPKNRASQRDQRRRKRRGAALLLAATVFIRGSPRRISLKLLRVAYMATVQKSPMNRAPLEQTRMSLAISFEECYGLSCVGGRFGCIFHFATKRVFYETGTNTTLYYLSNCKSVFILWSHLISRLR
jgi:hypothetical protein